jgi:hypothetical protein
VSGNAGGIDGGCQPAILVRGWQQIQKGFHERNPYGTPLCHTLVSG